MEPIKFKEANHSFGPPVDLEEEQCKTIPAHVTQVRGGSCDGVDLVVVAWKPSPEELERLREGAPVYLSCIGGLPPHFLTTDFGAATNPG